MTLVLPTGPRTGPRVGPRVGPRTGPPPAAALAKPDAVKAWAAAQAFEAQALGALLMPMMATVDQTGGAYGGGDAEATWRPMLTERVADSLAHAGGLGLAMPVFTQLMRMQEAAARDAAGDGP